LGEKGSSKEFYQSYNNGHIIYGCCKELMRVIGSVARVLEFGCGTGKNLNIVVADYRCGVDISAVALEDGRRYYEGIHYVLGSEEYLGMLADSDFDVSFTLSVLNHIEVVGGIVEQLKRVSGRVYLMESQDKWHEFCWVHDYIGMGFVETGYEWRSPMSGALYKLYSWGE